MFFRNALLAVALVTTAANWCAGEVTVARVDYGVVVKIDGQPFAEYRIRSGAKPIVWPIYGPAGVPLTRDFPMKESPGEAHDHPHHRSFWLTYGDVNGVNFWGEHVAGDKEKIGATVHREFVKVEGGPQGVIVARNDWIAPDGKKQCEDQRRLTFAADGDVRWIDFDATITASNGPVHFGDTKEGGFGIRIAETIKVDAKLGGRIVNSEGQSDAGAWGKRAAWVDYHGPVGGQTVGVAILNHPSSFRYPTYWHVRTYGLFTANPFGVRDFTGDTKSDGSYELPSGKSLHLRYRLILHNGDEKEGRIAKFFAAYAKEKVSSVGSQKDRYL